MREALEKIFVENVKDENWKEEDTAPESERPVSASVWFPVLVVAILYRLVVFVGEVWRLWKSGN